MLNQHRYLLPTLCTLQFQWREMGSWLRHWARGQMQQILEFGYHFLRDPCHTYSEFWVSTMRHINWMHPGVWNALNDSRNNCFFKLGPRRCKELMLENSAEAYANFIYFKISSKFKKNQTTLLDQDMWLTKKRNIHTTSKVCHLKRNAVIHSSTISQPAAYGS